LATQLAAQFSQNRGQVYRRLLDLWLEYWHDLLLVKNRLRDAVANVDRRPTLEAMARGYRLAQVKAFIDGIRGAAEQLKLNANARLVFEVLMMDMPRQVAA